MNRTYSVRTAHDERLALIRSYILEPEIHLSRENYLREAGLGLSETFRDEAISYFRRFSPMLSPRALYMAARVHIRSASEVEIGGELFESRYLVSNLQGVSKVYPYIATCGVELEEVVVGADDLERYWIAVLEEQALEFAFERLERTVAENFVQDAIASMNPGSAEAGVWPIEQQRPLFRLLGDVEGAIGVRLTGSCLMIPRKSVSGILFPTASGWVGCQVCSRDRCSRRRAPYDPKKRAV